MYTLGTGASLPLPHWVRKNAETRGAIRRDPHRVRVGCAWYAQDHCGILLLVAILLLTQLMIWIVSISWSRRGSLLRTRFVVFLLVSVERCDEILVPLDTLHKLHSHIGVPGNTLVNGEQLVDSVQF